MSTLDILKTAVTKWPDACAIIEGDQAISYAELSALCEDLKATLTAAGIGPGIGLAVMGKNSVTFVAAMLAGMACGATVLPLSSKLKPAEIAHVIEDTGLHAILDDLTGVQPLASSGISIPLKQNILRLAWTDVRREQAITVLPDAAFIRYTSGTTGLSKGVVISHARILERVNNAYAALDLKPGDAVLWVLPMAYHFIVSILVYIKAGASIILCRDLLAQTLIETANRYQATLLYAAPMHFRLLAADLSEQTFTTLKRVISTSSAIPPPVAKAFFKRFNLPVSQAYGIIEIGLPMLDQFSEQSRPETVGFPVPGFDVALLDANNQLVSEDAIGHLAIRGPGMFDAYLKPWRLATEVLNDGWFMTGDLARLTADGRIEIRGREKSMINVSGNKAFPEEIEAVLNSHQDIEHSRVFGQTHPLMGEIVCAEVVLSKTAKIDTEKILTFCRRQLSSYKVPQRLLQVSKIKRTQSGKIKR